MTRRLLSSLAFATVLFAASASKVSALEPKPGLRFGMGLVAGLPMNASGYGARSARNPEQLGFQLSLGYSVRGGLYVGGSVLPFLGQRDGTGDVSMTQMFTFDLGFAIALDTRLAVRPMLSFGMNRYGNRYANGSHESDLGFLFAPGLDLIADVARHFFLGGGFRVACAFMGQGSGDLYLSTHARDVSLLFTLNAGFRF